MLGGYQILDLRSIDLTIGSSASNITNIYVLNQLRNLREHIQKDYAFARPLNKQLKPVLIRYRDKKNDEKHEGAIFGSVQVKTNYYTFEISAILLGQTLNIEVVFEEKTDDDGNKYFDIKTAKILLTDNADIKGDLAVGGDLSVGDDASITGDASIGGDLTVTGAINGEQNPSVKPVYYHPVVIWGKSASDFKSWSISLVALTNFVTAFGTIADFINWIEENNITYLAPASGSIYNDSERYVISWIDITYTEGAVTGFAIRCQGVNTDAYLQQINVSVDDLEENFNISDTGVNKIN